VGGFFLRVEPSACITTSPARLGAAEAGGVLPAAQADSTIVDRRTIPDRSLDIVGLKTFRQDGAGV